MSGLKLIETNLEVKACDRSHDATKVATTAYVKYSGPQLPSKALTKLDLRGPKIGIRLSWLEAESALRLD